MSIDWNASAKSMNSTLEMIGRTPMVRLKKIPDEEGLKQNIFAKVEFVNPTGSHKDRIYYEMIARAIERGVLKPGMEILEVSTGNAGAACAFVGGLLGYKVTIVMPIGMSRERMSLIRAYGAAIITTPGAESDVDLCVRKVAGLKEANPGRYWEPDQYNNPDNVNAHYKGTGAEIWQQVNGKVDCFVASQGSGGTITGVGRFLREKNPDVLLYAVEPREAPMLSRRLWGSHKIEGIGDGFVPRNLDLSILNGVVATTSEEAIRMAHRLSTREGLFCGISSGCNVAAAVKIAEKHTELSSIVTMVNDSGQRYFSTELCGEKKEVEIPQREHPLDPYTIDQLNKYQKGWEIIE